MSRGRPDPRETVRRLKEAEARRKQAGGPAPGPAKIPDWAAPARSQKESMVAGTKGNGDIHPTVIVKRRGRVEAILIAPRVDRDLGLRAALTCRMAFDADEILFVVDAHGYRAATPEAFEEVRKRWPGGSMQRACDEMGECEIDSNLRDCINCLRVTTGGEAEMVIMPYLYHGPGTAFRWLDDEANRVLDGNGGVTLGGYVIDTLRKVMAQPTLLQSAGDAGVTIPIGDMDPERCRYISACSGMQVLAAAGYVVLDLLTDSGPSYHPTASHDHLLEEFSFEE